MIPIATAISMDIQPGWAVLLICVLLTLSFFFSGTEIAFFSLQKVQRKRFEEGTRTERQVVSLRRRGSELITTVLLGNEAVNIGTASVATALFAVLTPGREELITVAVVTPLMVLVSEITPKVLALRFNTAWTRAAAWPTTAFFWAVYPARVVIDLAVTTLARGFRVTGQHRESGLREAELRKLVEQSASATAGDVEDLERNLVNAVFEFDQLTVSRLMTPRPDLVSISIGARYREVLDVVRETGFSRLPVYSRRPNNLIGVLLVKDLLRYRSRPPSSLRATRTQLVPPTFVPASMAADKMLEEFLRRQIHMAFVVDEHGTLVGLITLDDLLAALVGGGSDDDETDLETLNPNLVTVRAGTAIEAFTNETGIMLPPGEYHTVGGFLFHRLGRLPEPGDECEFEGHVFQIQTMDGRRVAEVLVRLRAVPDQEAS